MCALGVAISPSPSPNKFGWAVGIGGALTYRCTEYVRERECVGEGRSSGWWGGGSDDDEDDDDG